MSLIESQITSQAKKSEINEGASIYNKDTSSLLANDSLTKLLFNSQLTNKNFFSYEDVLLNKDLFRRSGGRSSVGLDGVGIDNPITLYFKLFFYFDDISFSNDTAGAFTNNGLLSNNVEPGLINMLENAETTDSNGNSNSQSPETNKKNIIEKEFANSALNYLLLNGENTRARNLLTFINLLKNISVNTPWYFQSISGIGDALDRKALYEGIKIEDTRKKITIECLDDSVDQRIGTLLDLYRSVVYSQTLTKEIVPANLRKFNMGLFIFSGPIKNLHLKKNKEQKTFNYPSFLVNGTSFDIVGHKYIEFQNCEIDYNSSISGYDSIDNKEGFSPKYKLDIYYDRAFESRYNEFLCQTISDFISWDYVYTADAKNPGELDKTQQNKAQQLLLDRINDYFDPVPPTKEETLSSNAIADNPVSKKTSWKDVLTAAGKAALDKVKDTAKAQVNDLKKKAIAMPGKVLSQLKAAAMNKLMTAIGKLALGNLYYGTSYRDIAMGANNVLNGNLLGIVQNQKNKEKVKNAKKNNGVSNIGGKLNGYDEIENIITTTGKELTVKKIYEETEQSVFERLNNSLSNENLFEDF